MQLRIFFILLTMPMLFQLWGCKGRNVNAVNADIAQPDSLPEGVKKIVAAIMADDAEGFARQIDYPLERPYPLHDIADESAMKEYYRVLVDDSLKSAISRSKPGDWWQMGWRGWSVYDGQYFWLDENAIYRVNYISEREKAIKQRLVRREIGSLPKQLQGDWEPVGCFHGPESGEIFRIDKKPGVPENSVYRLAVFSSDRALNESPAMILTGSLEIQGTIGAKVYTFQGPDGLTVVYDDGTADSDPLTVDFEYPDGTERSVEVENVYWLDIIDR